MCRNGPRKENGQKNTVTKETKNERNIKDQNTKTTGADNLVHRTGQDNTYAQLERWNAETARRKDTTKKCADFQGKYNTSTKHHHQQKKIIGTTTKFKA